METLGASGKWFKAHYKTTPATSVTINEDLKESNKKTVWFNSRFYRANLLWEDSTLRFRDIHLFDEQLLSPYLTQKATSNACAFYTLPFVDGYIWSTAKKLAGLRFKTVINGSEMLLQGGDPTVTSAIPGTLHISWPITSFAGTLVMDIDERQMKMKMTGQNANNWFLDLTTADSAKLPFTKINPRRIDYRFVGMSYSIAANTGLFSQPGDSVIFKVKPVNNNLILDFSDANLSNKN